MKIELKSEIDTIYYGVLAFGYPDAIFRPLESEVISKKWTISNWINIRSIKAKASKKFKVSENDIYVYAILKSKSLGHKDDFIGETITSVTDSDFLNKTEDDKFKWTLQTNSPVYTLGQEFAIFVGYKHANQNEIDTLSDVEKQTRTNRCICSCHQDDDSGTEYSE